MTSESVPAASNDYAWRRGIREYLDNFHASITRKGWEGTDEEFAVKIDSYVCEALARFESGDVPGERGPAATKETLTKRLAASVGVDPVKLAAWLEKQGQMGRAA